MSSMNVIALIPTKYNASRFPGKPLIKFGDHTMIQKVYLQAKKSVYITETYVVTNNNLETLEQDKEYNKMIKKSVEEVGGKVINVDGKCTNGTDCICLVIDHFINNDERLITDDNTVIVNIQGDEPFVNPVHVDMCIHNYMGLYANNENLVCTTLHYKLDKHEDIINPNIGKLVLDCSGNIMYCSRAVIPSNKKQQYDPKKCDYLGHIGIFVFRPTYLIYEYKEVNTPHQVEEDIEWLKIIEKGFKINSKEVDYSEIGINTPEDYEYIIAKYYSGK